MSEKVYCKNCRYFVRALYDCPFSYADYCGAPTGTIIKDYTYGDYKERLNIDVGEDKYPNKRDSNGCKYYKRKWWKFWIRTGDKR